ncbi:hypothetical protein SEA_JIFALL16_78 [Gordonia phage Jifall16]|nr:hypothetical protein SEA_JIFALL16_78 [Gordonia phage Jifall16]
MRVALALPVSAVLFSMVPLRRPARYDNCNRYRATGATPGRVAVSRCSRVLLMRPPYTREPVVANLAKYGRRRLLCPHRPHTATG